MALTVTSFGFTDRSNESLVTHLCAAPPTRGRGFFQLCAWLRPTPTATLVEVYSSALIAFCIFLTKSMGAGLPCFIPSAAPKTSFFKKTPGRGLTWGGGGLTRGGGLSAGLGGVLRADLRIIGWSAVERDNHISLCTKVSLTLMFHATSPLPYLGHKACMVFRSPRKP